MLSIMLRQLRKEKNLTQEEMAIQSGVARTTYAMYEQNNRQPDYETLQRIADFFDVSIDYLLGRNINKLNKNNEREYDPIAHLNEKFDELGIKEAGFYDYEKWKNLNREEIEEVIKHFEYVVHKAEERKLNKKKP